MKITFLGQGYESISNLSVGKKLIEFLSDKRFHSFFGISAFASVAGVKLISKYIDKAKQTFKSIILIVGIDQEGTSKEALEEINELNIKSYIFYQKEFPIFHPKIYLFEGDNETKLIIGSSNLTASGLFANIESSLLVEFSNNDEDGECLLIQVKEYFNGIFDLSDPNLFENNLERIEDFTVKGIVPNEIERSKKFAKQNSVQQRMQETGLVIPKRDVAKIPKFDMRILKPTANSNPVENNENVPLKLDISNLVWISGPLTERDLNIPKGPNTNATGSMLFKKGKLEGIDQRHYFRDVVFSKLIWVRDSKAATNHLERANAKFKIVIDEIDCGNFNLTITHNTKTDTNSYKQKNSLTQISWGEAKKIIAKDALIGKNASLYKGEAKDEFIFNID